MSGMGPVVLLAVEGPLAGWHLESGTPGDRRPVWCSKAQMEDGALTCVVTRSARFEKLPRETQRSIIGCYMESAAEPEKLIWLDWKAAWNGYEDPSREMAHA